MKICFPVESNDGINSKVFAHFGSAPYFMIVDTNSLEWKAITNTNQHHEHGMCRPLAMLGNEQFDGIVVSGIGAGALSKLTAASIKVFQTEYPTILETLEAVKNKRLKEVSPQMTCNNHKSEPNHKHSCQE